MWQIVLYEKKKKSSKAGKISELLFFICPIREHKPGRGRKIKFECTGL